MTDSTQLPGDLEDVVREAMEAVADYVTVERFVTSSKSAAVPEARKQYVRVAGAIRTLAVRCAAAEARNTTMIKAPRPNENWLPELARAYDQMQEVKAKSEASVQEAREERAKAMVWGAIPGYVTVPDARRIIDSVIAAVRAEGEGKGGAE